MLDVDIYLQHRSTGPGVVKMDDMFGASILRPVVDAEISSSGGALAADTAVERLSWERVEEQFRQLFQNHLLQSRQSVPLVAARLGMSARNLHRILSGAQKMTTQLHVQLGKALGIDITRAVVAIAGFKDWRTYYDSTLIIAVDLLIPVIEMINERSPGGVDRLHPKAIQQLAGWISETVIRHHEEVSAFREDINFPENS